MNELMKSRIVRAIVLCDIIVEDLNSADLDITIHKAITELHRVILIKHKELTTVVVQCEHGRGMTDFCDPCGRVNACG